VNSQLQDVGKPDVLSVIVTQEPEQMAEDENVNAGAGGFAVTPEMLMLSR
jgi:hypothetical protein